MADPALRSGQGLPSGTVTFLFTDIESSADRWEGDPPAIPKALARHDELVRAAISAHGGQIFKSVGDAICAVFTTAPAALTAAVQAQEALKASAWPGLDTPRVRMALHTGAAEAKEGDYVGPPLTRASRLLAAGHGGQILLSQSTCELIQDALPAGTGLRDLGQHHLKGLARPERIFQVVADGLPADFPPLRSLESRPNNLPAQLTDFIGREQELAAAREVLVRARLLTLTGPGGTGKTRFAIQLAADVLDRYEDGAFFVGLAPIFDPDLVIPATAQALGVPDVRGRPPIESLKDYLRYKRLLLVLDNFEQVLTAGVQLTELLVACSSLTLLVTSRVALRLSGEHEIPVAPLTLPDLGQRVVSPVALVSVVGRSEAARLFVERARAVQPDFELTEENAAA
ncbi:MAG: adenylate/guanylate cyclase domain-containing protein, partial [Chloroflexota bacterium]|nr:adenylate/guanylate cyclase domain-containing protein [Chloroflexota bacterium]